MIVHDMTVNEKYIRIGYIKNENEFPQACTLKSGEYARPEFYSAMERVGHAIKNLGMVKNGDVQVIRISIKFTQDNKPSTFILAGLIAGDIGLDLKYTTEKISVRFDKDLTSAVALATKEAELFVEGKRAQTELNFEEGGNDDE